MLLWAALAEWQAPLFIFCGARTGSHTKIEPAFWSGRWSKLRDASKGSSPQERPSQTHSLAHNLSGRRTGQREAAHVANPVGSGRRRAQYWLRTRLNIMQIIGSGAFRPRSRWRVPSDAVTRLCETLSSSRLGLARGQRVVRVRILPVSSASNAENFLSLSDPPLDFDRSGTQVVAQDDRPSPMVGLVHEDR